MSKNAFELGTRRVIPAVLVYLWSENHVLMMHRRDGIWNGLGGKLDADESFLEAAKRETFEESGISIPEEDFKFLGILQFPLFKPAKNEDWLVQVYRVNLPKELKNHKLTHQTSEGSLHWVHENEVMNLGLWPGDSLFIPKVIDQAPFTGTIWYRAGEVFRAVLTAI